MRYSEMKDSGVEWIGEIPGHWNICKTLFGLSMPITDGPHTTPELYDSGIPFVSAEAVSCGNGAIDFLHIRGYISEEFYRECCKKYIPQRNDIYMIKSGATTGRVAIVDVDFPFAIWSPLAVFRVNKTRVVPRYMLYYLGSPAYLKQVELKWSFGTQQNIGMRVLEQLKICMPPLAEQKAIAAYLDEKCAAIDEIIGQAKATIEEYRAWKASVIFETVTKGLDPDAEMKDSGVEWIGKIPKHWKAVALKRLYDFSTGAAVRVGPFGSALSTADYTNSGELVYNQRVVLDKDFEQNAVFVSEQKARDLTSFSVFPGDILITTRGSIGKIMIVPPNAPKGILHPCIIRFRINSDKYSYRLLEYIFNDTDLIKNQILYHSNSTTIDVLYSYTLKELRIPLIPMNEQKTILDYLDKKCAAIDTIIEEKQTLIDELETYKKSLIFETVTGKRRVC